MKRSWEVRLFNEELGAFGIGQPVVERVVQLVCCFAREQGRDIPDGTIEVTFLDKGDIQEVNYDYRGKNYATDVISFAYWLDRDYLEPQVHFSPDFSIHKSILGEILICPQVAEEQAHLYENSPYQEIFRLLIHGTLHLCGYDHENVTTAEEQEMQSAEDVLWSQVIDFL
jgi:probable rRNA maturation factor